MRNRLERGRLNQAARGELLYGAPRGSGRVGKSAIELDPDEQAREVMPLICDTFDDMGSLDGLFQYLLRHNIRLPGRAPSGPNKGQ